MSFSMEVKEELSQKLPKARHCQLAELAALIACEGDVRMEGENFSLTFESDNPVTQKKYFTLLDKTTIISGCELQLTGIFAEEVLTAVKMYRRIGDSYDLRTDVVDGLLLQQTCCKRSFLRGCFLASGSISDPNKGYHLEIVCKTAAQANQLQEIMKSFSLSAKIVERKKHFVVYLKEGEQIVDMLNVMGAHVALMQVENIRIEKELRNSVNRGVNCETANLAKTAKASVRQIEDIEYIAEHQGLSSLPENLQEIAVLRLKNPEASLKELGELLTPPIGRSGVNHRLRRISEIAEDARKE